jgi:hypothetical protein
MWSDLIVFLSPLGNQYLGFGQRREDLPVEQFVPQFAVERLDIAILPGAARFDEEGFDTQSGQPFAYSLAVNSGPLSERMCSGLTFTVGASRQLRGRCFPALGDAKV